MLIKDKIYFASDFHLGTPNLQESHKREKHIIQWLTNIEKDAKAIYLVGDIFDFWFEYKTVVPKGFVRLLGKLAQLTDNGTPVHLFVGNHDLWMKDYLEKEVGVTIHHRNIIIEEDDKKLFIGHGDGLGNGDYLYKFLRKIFTSKVCQWAFARLHPNLALTIAHTWSRGSRKSGEEANFISNEKEILFGYCQQQQALKPVDYYVFGHRHLPLELKVDSRAKYINTGDWLSHYTYAILQEGNLKLKTYNK
ncbi:UDP-2,3-diacylglucosamine diphosphatase [Flavobacteriales bacterium]|nr:UDP-2,3-diacylglucosamine diphosphatase [Flavobacteriales bacterium]MDC3395020.1 UDP-2,3-diacylglucosamine diphosphatase [Flavobacteriales bacterium]MDG1349279.1 UDP-2,3-diacylglucosamine diphosphatase [Flavobacteriales bacterium]